MKIRAQALSGVFTVDIEPHEDERGLFARTWDSHIAKEHGLQESFDYSCISRNTKKGTLRGMHWQREPHGEVKLVRCTKGNIFDVVIDLRPDSETYKKWASVELSEENHCALYIPPLCAHGFLSLTDESEVLYDIAGSYVPEAAAGVRFDDPSFNIAWPFRPKVFSVRDAEYPDFRP